MPLVVLESEPKLVVADVPILPDRDSASTFELLIVESPSVALNRVASGDALFPDCTPLPIEVVEPAPIV